MYTFRNLLYCHYRILAHLINWTQKGTGPKARFRNQRLHICKIEFRLCIRTGPGQYQFVSPSSYSSIIEEGKIIQNGYNGIEFPIDRFQVMEL